MSALYPVNREALERAGLRSGEAREFNILDVPQRILDDDLAVPVKSVFICNHNPVAQSMSQRAAKSTEPRLPGQCRDIGLTSDVGRDHRVL